MSSNSNTHMMRQEKDDDDDGGDVVAMTMFMTSQHNDHSHDKEEQLSCAEQMNNALNELRSERAVSSHSPPGPDLLLFENGDHNTSTSHDDDEHEHDALQDSMAYFIRDQDFTSTMFMRRDSARSTSSASTDRTGNRSSSVAARRARAAANNMMAYEDPVSVGMSYERRNTSSSSSSTSSSVNDDDEMVQEQPPDDEEVGGQQGRSNHMEQHFFKKDHSYYSVCGTQYKRRCVFLGGLLLVLLVIALLTAIGFAVSTSSSNSNKNTNNAPPPTTPRPRQCSSARCGSSWVDANEKCGVRCGISKALAHDYVPPDCSSGGDDTIANCTTTQTESCPVGEYCFADLNPDLDCCREEVPSKQGSTPTTSAIPTTLNGPECASVRCGVSWIAANDECGIQCLTQPCPSGQVCFADLNPSLACCPLTESAQEPYFNPHNQGQQDDGPPMELQVCTSTRCGITWANANNYCLSNCESDDDCPGEMQQCYTDLKTDLDCCAPPPPPPPPCSTSRCGFTWSLANDDCGKTCVSNEACGDSGQLCFADLRTDLDCCGANNNDDYDDTASTDKQAYSCTTTRCGTDWTHAATTCGPNCINDGDCPSENAPRCYADLDTSLDCCPSPSANNTDNNNNNNSETLLASSCTSTRCGLDWITANSNCGINCLSNEDCNTEAGQLCYADLTTSLDCCSMDKDNDDGDTSNNLEQPNVPAASSICTTTRCGLDWIEANSNCGENCGSNDDCTQAGHSCFADLRADLDCCDDEKDSMVSSSCTTTRCGLSWGSANSNCGADCSTNNVCTEEGHACFADLRTDLDCCGDTVK